MQVQAAGAPKKLQWCPAVEGVLSAIVAGGGDEGTLQLWGVRSNDDHRDCYAPHLPEDAKPQVRWLVRVSRACREYARLKQFQEGFGEV
eukprot:2865764-Rhodomonas_salina.1